MERIGKEMPHDEVMQKKEWTNELPTERLDFQDFLVLMTKYMENTDAE